MVLSTSICARSFATAVSQLRHWLNTWAFEQIFVIFSNRVYLDTIAQRHTDLRSSQLRQVTVQVKEYSGEAWLYVPGYNVHDLELPEYLPRSQRQGATDASDRTAGRP